MNYRISNYDEYKSAYKKSIDDPEGFWEEVASEFDWKKRWDKVLEWNFSDPGIKWFLNGKLNITENCLDRHLSRRGEKTALIWEPNEPEGKVKKFTYSQLHERVCKFGNVLRNHGVGKGDRVAIYMPMVPDLTVAVLACARVGAVHSVVFAGFSAKSLADRINDAQARMVITTDGMYRGKKKINVKKIIDEAVEQCSSVEKILVGKSTGADVNMDDERDLWLNDELEAADTDCPAESMDSEDMLFILYTSGSTGKPKGVVHTCGGYMVYTAYSFENVFQYDEDDVYWCTADIGWITGHSYIIYGPLLAGATTLMYEGVPTYPDPGRFWQICEKHKVNQFYTAPTAIRALMAQGEEYPNKYALEDLKVLGTVGEPINKEAWKWYHEKVGKKRCAIVDTWWQTETGGIMLSGLGNISPQKPTYAGYPLPGIQPELVNADGEVVEDHNVEGYLCIKHPWPSILRTIYGDHERCRKTYFSIYKNRYFSGDGAFRDNDGLYRVIGRVDDVINVSGHRFGTAEIENAIDEHNEVTESAVVGYPHEIKGQGIYAYVISGAAKSDADKMREEILETVSDQIGKIAKPDKIQFVDGLPKTRSGKIMRRILRKIAGGDTSNLGDTSTLLDPEVVEDIKNGAR